MGRVRFPGLLMTSLAARCWSDSSLLHERTMAISTTHHDWRRLPGFAYHWHFGVADEEHFLALCGRVIESDVEVEIGLRPAHDERCDDCERLRVDRMRVEQGLAELRNAPTHEDYASAHEFDFGGES